MWSKQFPGRAMTPSNLIAALFFDHVSARDAIADLKTAGFGASSIGTALSEKGKQAHASSDASHISTQPVPEGKHSLLWRLRHSFERDLHSQGTDLSSREDAAAANEDEPPYTEIDLTDTLVGLGIAEDTIRLLDREIGVDGVLIMVDADDLANEVESILAQNRGMLRTSIATERSPTADR
jgi:hypothetical protein